MESPGTTSSDRSQTEIANDRTLYWTLSFYIPVERLREAAGPAAPAAAQPPVSAADKRTRTLRDAIEPLFNDIADRSRLGKIEDRMFAGSGAERLVFRMPECVRWATEGHTFAYAVPPAHRDRSVGLRSFWYAHSNGALSWHLSFAVHYGPDLERDLKAQMPSTYYFLSLLQKLAWPKEFRATGTKCSMHKLIGIDVRRRGTADMLPFWDFVERRFADDWQCVAARHPLADPGATFAQLVRTLPSIEVPGLDCPVSRSLFFIRDHHLMSLIQPKDGSGALVKRQLRVSDTDFSQYPVLIEKQRRARSRLVELDAGYWTAVLNGPTAPGRPGPHDRLAYLFLAGFNQNIVDFTNQEASEVLDSLDPIYPNSETQEQEGFFVRYANPRSMITYVSRSRTLEVGNDHIGTCPYAFLIHALSMHNEALTQAQEEATFAAIDSITHEIECGRAVETGRHGHYEAAERLINETRIAAFQIYDRHRYANPFRYDTERDVFDELERLRGTSRLKLAYEAALASLEEQARDLERLRQAEDDAETQAQDRKISGLLGALGIFGVIQVVFQIDQFVRSNDLSLPLRISLSMAYCGVPILAGILLFRFSRRKRRRAAQAEPGASTRPQRAA